MPLDVHATPNPLARRVVVPDLVVEVPRATVRGDAAGDPLASALFADPAITSVLVATGFVTVTAEAWAPAREAFVADLVARHAAQAGGDAQDLALTGVAYKVQSLLDWEIRPTVAAHGGDVRLIEVRDGVAVLAFRGACDGCPSAVATLQQGIVGRLLGAIPELTDVVAEGVA